MPVQGYRDLLAWQKARKLTTAIYRQTSAFPDSELYGLTKQLRRAAVSVASNIAEGQRGQPTGEFVQFLGIARGSLFEIETQLAVAEDLGFLKRPAAEALVQQTTELAKILQGLIASLQPRMHAGRR
jgi:four helix bundle protein